MPPRPRRPLWTVALALAGAAVALVAAAPAAGAQPADPEAAPPPVASVRVVRSDADRDGAPDRAGEAVAVAGRVTAGPGLTGPGEVYVQDRTGGLRVVPVPGGAAVATGDSVRVVGRLAVRAGTAELADAVVDVLPLRGPAPPPAAHPLRAGGDGRVDLEDREGEVVEVEGRAVRVGPSGDGHRLAVLVGSDLVTAVAPAHRTDLAGFAGIRAGDHVRVRGVLAQDGTDASGGAAYVVYPLSAGDVRRRGLSPAEYKWGALGVGGLLLLALAWAVSLRAQVRRRTRALRATEARYGHLLEAAADPVVVLDVERGGEIVEANRAAQRAFGIAADGARPDGRSVRLTDLAVDEQEARFHLADADRNGAVSVVLELLQPGGKAVPFEIATRRLRDRSAFVSVARDVEERRAYEHGLLQAIQTAEEAREQAEKAAQLQSSILANMSHEIRTPLTAVLGFADILRAEVPDDLREYAETVHAGGQRLLDTLNNILDLARLDAERAPVEPEDIDAVPVVEGAVALLAPLAQRKGIGLHVQSAARAIPARHSRTALERVVTNLVGNAIKFTDHGEVRVSLHAPAGYVVVRVRDTGVGISDAFLPEIYEAFKQESDGHARSHEGTGLGLTIAKRLVDLMGGEIRVWSRKDEGTMFEVVLPAAVPDAAPSDAAPEPDAAPAPGHAAPEPGASSLADLLSGRGGDGAPTPEGEAGPPTFAAAPLWDGPKPGPAPETAPPGDAVPTS